MTQEQFEVFCEDVATGGYITNLNSSALISGYKIPNQYLNIFYPNILHLNLEPEVICSLAKNWNTTDLVVRLLENNYRIKGFDYSNKEFQKIITAKKIFLKDGFKTIE